MAISKRNKYSYSIGCVGRDMNFILVSMFILVYIQYTMKLSVAQFSAISMIMVIARIWDAINDPLMGIVIENSNLKGGKFRPWILIGGLTNFITTILLFSVRPSGWLFVVFFAIAYIAWGMTYTINDIAYWSLLPNLSKNNEERNVLTNLVVLFASLGQFLSGGLIPVLVTGNAIMMYKIIGIVISFLFLSFTLLTYFGVQEEKRKVKKEDRVGFKKLFKILFNNSQLIVMTIVLFLQTIAVNLFVAMSMNFFYFEFGYGGGEISLFTVVFGIATLSGIGFFSIATKKFNRMKILTIVTIISSIGYIIFFSLRYVLPMNLILLYISTFMVFFGLSTFFIVIVVMTANTIEYNEVRTGSRNESIVFSVRPFMTKLASAVQQLIVSLVLVLSGVYAISQEVAKLEIAKSSNSALDITLQANAALSNATPYMLFNIRITMAIIPLASLLIAYILIKKYYIIDEEYYDKLLLEISEKEKNKDILNVNT